VPTLPEDCKPGKRCRRWRDCDACARIRQAKIADAAEGLLAGYMQLSLVVVTPADKTPVAMQKAIRAAIRNNGLRAGIWTVERGEKAGTLHANLLTHHTGIKPQRGATIHAETVRTSARTVAAYISKRRQAPRADEYAGKTYSTWGRLADWAYHRDQSPIIQGAAIETDMQGRDNQPAPQPARIMPAAAPDLSIDEYRAIAARHMPTLAALSDQFKRR
jgi:hypothetical protein